LLNSSHHRAAAVAEEGFTADNMPDPEGVAEERAEEGRLGTQALVVDLVMQHCFSLLFHCCCRGGLHR
jgi:hypothetical protein